MSEEPENPHHERHYEELARILNDAAIIQDGHQNAIGFGQEGDDLRRRVAEVRYTAPVGRYAQDDADARRDLRNYYIAKLALITTEVAEAIEELRDGRAIDETYYSTDPQGVPTKPEGVPSEIADALIRVLSLAGEVGIPIGDVVVQKLRYNETRAQKHGGKVI